MSNSDNLADSSRHQIGAAQTAFVLAGGGALGSIQVGMLRALVRHGVKPDLLIGSSVGAINAAYFAAHPDAEGVERLASIWLGMTRRQVFPITLRGMIEFLRHREAIVSQEGISKLIALHIPFELLEQARVPLYVVASDVVTGDAVTMSRGSARDAIVASTAIPAAFRPVQIEGRSLVDAAVASNTPVRKAVEIGARKLIVLPTGFICAGSGPPKGALDVAMHSLTLLIARQLVSELDGLGSDVSCHIVPPICPLAGSVLDFSRSAELIARGEAVTEAWIAEGGLDQSRIPGALRPHHH
jgi:NTE family protein